jgi:hypothetical protein
MITEQLGSKMAVIREKRQYSIGPIGIARASEGGRITGEAIARSADTFSQMFFEQALTEAKQTGEQLGKSVALSDIKGIDPKTKKPVALNEMDGMGRAKAAAFQRVVNSRFEQSMEEEIHAKASVLAEAVDGRSNSTELFSKGMFEYLEQMSEQAGNEYGQFIRDTGAVWTTRSVAALEQANIKRQKAQAKADLARRQQQELDRAFDAGLSGSPDAFLSAQKFIKSEFTDLASVAGDDTEQSRTLVQRSTNFALGYVNNKMTPLTPNERFNLVQSFIRHTTNSVPLTPKLQKIKNEILKYLPDDPSDIMDFGAKADVSRKSLDVYNAAQTLEINTETQERLDDLQIAQDNSNLRLSGSLDDNDFFSIATVQPNAGYQRIEELRDRLFNITNLQGKGFLKTETVNKLQGLLEKAEDQVLTAIVLKNLPESIEKNEDKLSQLKVALQSGSITSLKTLGMNASQQEIKILGDLFAVASTSQLQGIANGLKERATFVANNQEKIKKTFLQNNQKDMFARIVNATGESRLDVIEEIRGELGKAGIRNLDDLKFIEVANATATISDFLTDVAQDDELLISEINLLASQPNALASKLPLLNEAKAVDFLRSTFKKIPDAGDRQSLVTSYLERVKGLNTARDASVQNLVEQADAGLRESLVLDRFNIFDASTVSELEDARSSAINKIASSKNTSKGVRDGLRSELSKEVSRRQVSLIVQAIDDENAFPEISSILNDPTVSQVKNSFFDTETFNALKNAALNYGSTSDQWKELSSYAQSSILDKVEFVKALELEAENNLQIQSFEGGFPIKDSNTVKVRNEFEQYALTKFNLPDIPSDLYTNSNKYLSAEAGTPEYAGGQFLSFIFSRSREIMPTSLQTYFERAATGAAYNGQNINLQDMAALWRNVGSYTDSENRTVTTPAASDAFGKTELLGVIEGITKAATYGVPPEYLDEIRTVYNKLRADPQGFDNDLVANYGVKGGFDHKSIYNILSGTIGSKYDASPQLHGVMTDYLRGLYIAGASQSAALETVDNFFANNFSEDPYVVDLTGNPLNDKTHVNLNSTIFGANKDAAIAFVEQQLINEIGEPAFNRQYLRMTMDTFDDRKVLTRGVGVRAYATGEYQTPLGVAEFDTSFMGSKRELFLFPTVNSSTSKAEFRLAAVDQNGQIIPIDSNVSLATFGKSASDFQEFLKTFKR